MGTIAHDTTSSVNSKFKPIFARLRSILEPYGARLKVTADTADRYCLEVPSSPELNKSFPAAWVSIDKNYVSYHLMPVTGNWMVPTEPTRHPFNNSTSWLRR